MRFLFIWILLLFTVFARSQAVMTVNNPAEMVNLANEAQFLQDAVGALTIQDILQSNRVMPFKQVAGPAVNFSVTSSFFWIKSNLRNETDETLFLQIGNHALTDILVYEVIDSRIVKQYHSGNWLPFDKREVKDVDYLFPLMIPKNTTATIYIRVMHYRGTQFPLHAGSLTAVYNNAGNRHLIEGIYYGFMLLMVLYNLFIYFSLKDSSYLYYVAYIFLMGLLNATINGYAFRYFWPSAPILTQYEDIIAALVGVSGILFASKFLNTKENVPGFHKVFIALLIGYIINIGVTASGSFLAGTICVEMLSLLLVASFFIAAYRTLNKGYKPAKFFLIAWSLLLVSVIVFILEDYKILPYNALTVNSLQIGSAVEALLLSMALANRINVYKEEKEQAQMENLRSLKQNEKLVREQNMLLERKVEERTHELKAANKELLAAMENLSLTQAQLVQKEKMASLGELTAGIAHEIQNPLNFVNNFSEINTELTEELKQEMEKSNLVDSKESFSALLNNIIQNSQKITHHGKRAEAIVKGMLQHSRTSTGEKEPFDINALADEYLRLSYHGLRAKDKSFNAGFKTNFDKSIGLLPIVPQDIGRVLLNLFNNAFYSVTEKKKHLKDGYEPLVQLETKRIGDKVHICVRDNGLGVPQKVIDKIFQPFFTTKPTGEGTGLGLSLSYEIITKDHGGILKLNTKEGEYAEFIIELPVREATANQL
jgi:signal transduction histidine kinase